MQEDVILTLDLAVHEVANSIWKHQNILKDISDGLPYLTIFFGLIEAGTIRVVSPSGGLMRRAYMLSAKYGLPTYDTVFVSLALEAGLVLKTFDEHQRRIMRLETEHISDNT